MGFFKDSVQQGISRGLLVVPRLYLGVVFLVASWSKLSDMEAWMARLQPLVGQMIRNSFEFYRGFLENTVIGNSQAFAYWIAYGELLVGIALVLGLFTRASALGAMFLLANYLFAQGLPLWSFYSNDAPMFFIALVLLLGAAGRSFGLDYFLSKRWPAFILW